MRFTQAWAEAQGQNTALKVAVLVLGLCLLLMTSLVIKLSLETPLIIDSQGAGVLSQTKESEHSVTEIKTFLLKALKKRFDSTESDTALFLSPEEEAARQKEQQALRSKDIDQRILIRSIEVDKNGIKVHLDRIIAVKNLRSALPLELQVELSRLPRTELNPFGLVIFKVKYAKEKAPE